MYDPEKYTWLPPDPPRPPLSNWQFYTLWLSVIAAASLGLHLLGRWR